MFCILFYEKIIITSSPEKPTDPNKQPIELTTVKPEDSGGEGGFDASVDDWGDETEIEIPI